MSLSPETRERIDSLVKASPVVLFMKGSKAFPQCGFSSAVVQLLSGLGVDFDTHNVLQDPELRSGIKEFSDWPTIPQLYINEEFVGGSDIVRQMAASGELHGLLGLPYEAPKPPNVTVTDAMVGLFKSQAGDGNGDLRLRIGRGFQYELGVDREQPGDFKIETNGVTVLVDAQSAKMADGITIDFEDDDQGGGVVISNPNEPKPVNALGVEDFKAMIDAGETFECFDVRGPEERAIAHIEGSRLLDQEGVAYLEKLPKDTRLVFYCHMGGRSQQAAEHFRREGYTDVHNLVGGIEAWSLQIDTSIARY